MMQQAAGDLVTALLQQAGQQLAQWTVSAEPPAPPGLSIYVIIALGTFMGNIAMGICGFGTAIIHLTIWVLAQVAGFDAGPLDQAVITCSCAMTIGMVPLYFLAQASHHAVKPLAISIPIGKAIAAPFGALVLKLLPAQKVEAIVAVLMLVMIVLINRTKLRAVASAAWHRRLQAGDRRRCKLSESVPDLHFHDDPRSQQKQSLSCKDNSGVPPELRVAWISGDEEAGFEEQELQDDRKSSGSLSSSSSSSSGSSSADDGPTQDCEDVLVCVRDDGEGDSPLLEALLPVADSSAALADADEQQQHQQQHQQQLPGGHSFGWLLAIGALTGLCTGTLGGATGIAGPPLMLLYAYLDMTKDAVRGTNAVMSLVQDQWIGYAAFGMLHWSFFYLYLTAAVAGAAGMAIGHVSQKCMSQTHFKAVMSGLMAVCCALMCCSAAGWISLAAEGG